MRYPAGAAEFSYKMATDKEPTHPTAIRLLEAVDRIKRDTNGQLEIRVFLNNSLGGQAEMPTQVRLGAVEMICSGRRLFRPSISQVPVLASPSVPFIFSSQKDAYGVARRTDEVHAIKTQYAKVNVYSFGHSWDNGFRQMVTASRPIQNPDDLKGLKMRTPPSPITVSLFKAFGASPTSISANEMYTALQTHLVDGLEVPLSTIDVYKLPKSRSTSCPHEPRVDGVQGPRQRGCHQCCLRTKLRDVAERSLNAGGNANNADFVKLMAGLEAQLKTRGMAFNTPDGNAFRTIVKRAGLYTQWKDTYGPQAWSLLEGLGWEADVEITLMPNVPRSSALH